MTGQYAVIGRPIHHTKSPQIHLAFAKMTEQEISYIAIEGKLDSFASQLDEFRDKGGSGINVTAPFKLDAYNYATSLQRSAALAGATNCLKFDGNDAKAENFDGIGLTHDITVNLSIPLKGKRVLLLGAGGAARGALFPFLQERPYELVLVNRTFEKAMRLKEQFRDYGEIIPTRYEDLSGTFDIVVNATSASLQNLLPPLPPGIFRNGALAYELLYGKGATPFLRYAKDQGASFLADGVGMLVEQAAEAFSWWRGIRPQTEAVIKAMTIPIET